MPDVIILNVDLFKAAVVFCVQPVGAEACKKTICVFCGKVLTPLNVEPLPVKDDATI